jgi:flavin-dependent dehydrogenase
MERTMKTYDCAIIGGGLAGLCLAIQLAERDIEVILFEKNEYPFHKVCGEYISMESLDFLKRLGLPFETLNLPVINQLGISSEKGFMLNHSMKMGGFGISRYSLDHYLSQIAARKRVTIVQNCRVNSVEKGETQVYEINTSQGSFSARIVCGSYGKYTPSFIQKDKDYAAGENAEPVNYIGVKYHIKTDLAQHRIELHNFSDGYCGISKVDQDWYCLCYLTTSRNLQNHGKDIKVMEEQVLYRNPHLKRYFSESEFVNATPLVISNIHFRKKQTHLREMFLLGDAAGSITPLCGNGMSMGMRASSLLATELTRYFNKQSSLEEALVRYNSAWNKNFGQRITAGYYLQSLFGKKYTTHFALKTLAKLPAVMDKLVSLTHGQTF